MLVYVHVPEDNVDMDEVNAAFRDLARSGMTPVFSPVEDPQDIIARSDAVLFVSGAALEDYAIAGPTYTYPDMPQYSPTEIKYPEQVHGFMEKIMAMYRVHLQKNEDYSPANIMGAGEIGIATRLWDKMARLMNLVGFDIVIESAVYDKPKNPRHESIEDNALDLSVYGVILQLYREGKWAR